MDCSPPGYSVHGILQARILEWVATSFLGGLPDPGIKPMSPASPALSGRFFNTEPAGKPFNTLETNNLQLCSHCSLCYRECTLSSKLCVLYLECQLKPFSCHSHIWGWKTDNICDFTGTMGELHSFALNSWLKVSHRTIITKQTLEL